MEGRFDYLEDIRWLPCKNASASLTIPPFSLVRATGYDSDGNVTVDRPNADNQYVLVTGPVEIGPEKYGRCTANGLIRAGYLYEFGIHPSNDESWGAAADSYVLKRNNTGFKIIGSVDTANNTAFVARPTALPGSLRGKLDTALTPGGSAVMSVWIYSGGESDTGENITVYDWLLPTGGSMPAASKVIAFWHPDSSRWYVVAEDSTNVKRGVLDGSLAQGSSATMSVWAYSGSDADTGENLTVYDWLLGSGESLLADTEVVVAWFPDSARWYVIAAECSGGFTIIIDSSTVSGGTSGGFLFIQGDGTVGSSGAPNVGLAGKFF